MKSINQTILLLAAITTLLGLQSNALADQPLMHEALVRLRAARSALVAAEHNKGGWRDRAIASVDAAIQETKNGIGFERTH